MEVRVVSALLDYDQPSVLAKSCQVNLCIAAKKCSISPLIHVNGSEGMHHHLLDIWQHCFVTGVDYRREGGSFFSRSRPAAAGKAAAAAGKGTRDGCQRSFFQGHWRLFFSGVDALGSSFVRPSVR